MKKLTLSVLVVLCFGTPALACPSTGVTNSGRKELVCADSDRNGKIEEGRDCCLFAYLEPLHVATTSTDAPGDFCVELEQGPDSKIAGCDILFDGNIFLSTIALTGTNQAGEEASWFNGLFIETTKSPGAAALSGLEAGGAPEITGVKFSTFGGSRGEGALCNAAVVPGLEIIDYAKHHFGVRFERISSDGTPYNCVAAPLPVETGGTEIFDICVPVDGLGNSQISLGDKIIAIIPFSGRLNQCGERNMAPTLGQWGLVSLAVLLLLAGVYLLRRGRGFGAGLLGG
jgi:hypothetical protein